MIYLNKILPYFFYPTTIILVLLIWGIISKKRVLFFIASAIFLITSNPMISDQLLQDLEKDQIKKSIDDVKQADAIVVLSGMLTSISSNQGIVHEWSDPDRFFGGLELIEANKSERIIFTGGKLPWQKNNGTEGEVLASYAKKFGINSQNIQITKEVQNTEDEAKAVRELLAKEKLTRIILVTSAFHMPRAQSLFEKQGLEVQTYPVDFKIEANNRTILDFLPSARAMKDVEFSIRELLGRAYYQVKGL
jgi:uncharacterized SAM-binding protein YcdF (DUF218 family)